ncbi:MAG: DegT/DnrJ/EryC1/StrS family aminotransferase [Kiloniellales bacterium]|nr:DegT/DnrJ/EryC1/StrS family aminotransferase [Kiloniellales bacterium]
MAVPFYLHDLDPEAADAVAEVIASPFLTSGKVGREVEDRLRDFFGIEHALLVNSWTNGAVATLLALGVGPGDEVIVPAMTFIASANVAGLVGARPVFVDVDPETLLVRPEAVAAAVTPRTRAVIPVHLYGRMCDLPGLRAALAPRDDIAIIEDAAHCFEGLRDGDPPGRHAEAAIFSFYATKNVTCGEGGAVITRDPELAARLARTRLHGMSELAIDRMRDARYQHWDMLCLGTKANLPDLLAALLPPQIARVRAQLDRREALAARYEAAFADSPLRLPGPVAGCLDARHLFCIHVPPACRDQAILALNARGIGVTVNYRAVPTLTYYREAYGYGPEDFPVSRHWGEGTLSLPLYPRLTEAQQDEVIAAVLEDVVPLAQRNLP